jgi:hypothetical protein
MAEPVVTVEQPTLDATLPPATPEPTTVADTSLNGAQVASLMALAGQIAHGQIPMDTGRALINASFPMLTPQQVDDIIAPLASFTPPLGSEPPAIRESESGVISRMRSWLPDVWRGYP